VKNFKTERIFWIIANLIILLSQRVRFHLGDLRLYNGVLRVRNEGRLEIGKGTIINSSFWSNPIGGQTYTSLVVGVGAWLSIGPRCAVSNSSIVCTDRIELEGDVYVGADCRIYDTDFHSIASRERLARPETGAIRTPVRLERASFLGTGCLVLRGTVVGAEAVIGAGSVLKRKVPSGEVWAGNPCRFIKPI